MAKKKEPDLTARVEQAYRDGEQYQRDVAAALEELGGDDQSPEWFEWCRQMDAWRAATAEAGR